MRPLTHSCLVLTLAATANSELRPQQQELPALRDHCRVLAGSFGRMSPMTATLAQARQTLDRTAAGVPGDRATAESDTVATLTGLATTIRAQLAERRLVADSFAAIIANLDQSRTRLGSGIDRATARHQRDLRQFDLLEPEIRRAAGALHRDGLSEQGRRRFKRDYTNLSRVHARIQLLSRAIADLQTLRRGVELLGSAYREVRDQADDTLGRLEDVCDLFEFAAGLHRGQISTLRRFEQLLALASRPVAELTRHLLSAEDQIDTLLRITEQLDRSLQPLGAVVQGLEQAVAHIESGEAGVALDSELSAILDALHAISASR